MLVKYNKQVCIYIFTHTHTHTHRWKEIDRERGGRGEANRYFSELVCTKWWPFDLVDQTLYLSRTLPNERLRHRALFKWVRAQSSRQNTPRGSKNALGPVGIPLKKDTWGSRCAGLSVRYMDAASMSGGLARRSKTTRPSHTNWSVQRATRPSCDSNCKARLSQSQTKHCLPWGF